MKIRAFRAETFLLLTSAAAALSFAVWDVLLNNFVIEQAAFTGREIGILQSLREVPGFLAFTTVFVLLVIREQNFALISLLLLGLGVSLTGFLPSEYGLYFTTVLMSTGFHYFYTVQQSLALQWFDAGRTPLVLGRISAASSYASLLGFGLVWLCMQWLDLGYVFLYVLAGGVAIVVAVLAWRLFPHYEQAVPQHKHLLMRRRYWLYYGLTFLSGARRQIFMVFATFLMVEKFGYSAAEMALLYILNHSINSVLAPRIGRFIAHFGERLTLTVEYVGLIFVFSAYAFVEVAWVAAALFVVDHIFYAMAIAIRSYFKKIADPADMASTASVAFTINHIAAVIIPVSFGLLWMVAPAAVFLAGAGLACCSLLLALMVPRHPQAGNEVQLLRLAFGKPA